MARAQTLVMSGGSGSAHRAMRNGASRRSGEIALDDVDDREVQRLGIPSTVEKRLEEGDHAQQRDGTVASLPRMYLVAPPSFTAPSAARTLFHGD